MISTTVIIGLVLAFLYIEITGLLPGGIVVPAFLALYLDRPWRVLATFLAAFLALGCYKILNRFFLLFGRRRFVLMLLLGAAFGQLLFLLWPHLVPATVDLRVIGGIIPGLLANNLERQKFWPTLASLTIVTVATFVVSRLIALL
jgi:poly-gamma-glutamate biosynthesis protein PgsC/CapC